MKLKLINKKASVPIAILVIGVIAICSLTIISFLFSPTFNQYPMNMKIFEDIYSDIEEFNFYLNVGLSKEEAIKNLEIFYTGEDSLKIENNILILNRQQISKNNEKISIEYRYKIE